MMRFKKVYIEITNACNLNCSFCAPKKREVKYLNFEEFKIILSKLKGYTKYLYFHILGEPLIHPLINDFINYAAQEGFNINLTTNGYLMKKIINNQHIRQINISLHSYHPQYGLKLDDYLHNIFEVINNLPAKTYINLRWWVNNSENEQMQQLIKDKYLKEDMHNVYFSYHQEFIWPDFQNDYDNPKGKCYGLIDHIGILVDGTVIPCCLDSQGLINLGNIFEKDLDEIMKSERVNKMIKGFKKGEKCEELCKKCHFLE